MWNKYYESFNEINPNIYLVKQSLKNNLFKRCEIKSFKCTDYKFNKNQLMNLVEGRLVINDREYQYVGKMYEF